jgi:two-component system cell cycle response regulator
VGVAAPAGEADKLEDILKRADQALYQAKREGRNRVVLEAA